MDELIWRSLQGNTNEDDERLLAEWRAALPANEQHYQTLVDLWDAASSIGYARPDARRVPAATILHLADVQADMQAAARADRRRRASRLIAG